MRKMKKSNGQGNEDIYGLEVSDTTVILITDKILPIAKEWQQRPLESVYALVSRMPFSTMSAARDRFPPLAHFPLFTSLCDRTDLGHSPPVLKLGYRSSSAQAYVPGLKVCLTSLPSRRKFPHFLDRRIPSFYT